MDALTTGIGDALTGHPVLLTFGAHAWLTFLLASTLLVLVTGRLRTTLVVVFAGGYLFMLAILRIDLFPPEQPADAGGARRDPAAGGRVRRDARPAGPQRP